MENVNFEKNGSLYCKRNHPKFYHEDYNGWIFII